MLQSLNYSIYYNYSNQQLITASEDGLVMLWDTRTGKKHNKVEPHTNTKVSRPDIGKWVGSAAIGDDWIVSIALDLCLNHRALH